MGSKDIDHDRRRFVEGAAVSVAAAAALSMLPEDAAAVTTGNGAIRPLDINFPEEQLVDLRRRINATRFPERETVTDQSQGVQLATVQKLARYWATEYDWRKVEAKLNSYPHFITEIDGLDIHFIHVRSKHENALPVIVTHGWPGSVIEQLKIIDPLTNPDRSWRQRVGRLPCGDSVDARATGSPASRPPPAGTQPASRGPGPR